MKRRYFINGGNGVVGVRVWVVDGVYFYAVDNKLNGYVAEGAVVEEPEPYLEFIGGGWGGVEVKRCRYIKHMKLPKKDI